VTSSPVEALPSFVFTESLLLCVLFQQPHTFSLVGILQSQPRFESLCVMIARDEPRLFQDEVLLEIGEEI
jgi:hypothetical protein